ncbi:putative sporulation protein YtxC [Paenibacillus sanguinis]|uniref:putative sporulation protein YtxC n=1 Tax=Paenibacillus sanguinis TaxID=225906 RepID=UPI000365F16A|nr:putative sporulation protein YtxC [Paenibacillus sanguinis]
MDFFSVRINCASAEAEERFKNTMHEVVCSLQHLHDLRVSVSFGTASGEWLEAVLATDSSVPFEAGQDGNPLIDVLARELANYLVEVEEPKRVLRIMRREYSFASREEEQFIAEAVMSMLAAHPENGEWGRRTSLIYRALYDYLLTSPQLQLSGFAAFRLKAYDTMLSEAIDLATDDYLHDQQYEEFISLLQYFVGLQETLTPLVHLMHKQGPEFSILNEQFAAIHVPDSGGVVARIADQEIQMEDVIVSTLISLSPERILLHTQEPDAQIIKTISRIFGERVELCLHCPHCQLFHQEVRKLESAALTRDF